jgi:hypothetical protein
MSPRRLKRSERFERIIAALRQSPTVRISELATPIACPTSPRSTSASGTTSPGVRVWGSKPPTWSRTATS